MHQFNYVFSIKIIVVVLVGGTGLFVIMNKFGMEQSSSVSEAISTNTYVNTEYGFQFDYPRTHEVQTVYGNRQALGIRVKRINRLTSQELLDELFISLPPQIGGGYNLSATSLSDYESTYHTRNFACPSEACHDSEKIFYEARIHDTERRAINGVIGLRQIYSTGIVFLNNVTGEQVFDTSSVYGEGIDHGIRYVFMNPKDQTVIILGPWIPEINDIEFAERIVNTFTFIVNE